MTDEEIEDAAMVVTMALDPKSPFRGMVDMSELFDQSIEDQWKVFKVLPARIKAIVRAGGGVMHDATPPPSSELNKREFAKMMKARREESK